MDRYFCLEVDLARGLTRDCTWHLFGRPGQGISAQKRVSSRSHADHQRRDRIPRFMNAAEDLHMIKQHPERTPSGGVLPLLAGEAVPVAIAAVAGAVGEPVVDVRLNRVVNAEGPGRVAGGVPLQLGARRVLHPPVIARIQ